MTQVNIDKDLYNKVRNFVYDGDKIEYPTINNFIERAIKNQLRIETLHKKELSK